MGRFVRGPADVHHLSGSGKNRLFQRIRVGRSASRMIVMSAIDLCGQVIAGLAVHGLRGAKIGLGLARWRRGWPRIEEPGSSPGPAATA